MLISFGDLFLNVCFISNICLNIGSVLISTLLYQNPLHLNEGKYLESGTIWSVSHTIIRAIVCLCLPQLRYAVVSNLLFCVVLLPCLRCVICDKDAFGVSVYMYILQLLLTYWLVSNWVDCSHLTTSSQVSCLMHSVKVNTVNKVVYA